MKLALDRQTQYGLVHRVCCIVILLKGLLRSCQGCRPINHSTRGCCEAQGKTREILGFGQQGWGAWTQAWTPGNFREAVRADAPTTGWATSYWVGLWLIVHKITLKSNWPDLLGTGILG